MTRLFIIFFCFIFLLPICSISHAEESQNNHAATSAFLFGDTLSWTPVNKMRKPDKAYLKENKKRLRDAYFANRTWNNEKTSCPSFIDTIFSPQADYNKFFRLHDLDKDGVLDVLYTGDAICEEGDVTLIWYGHRNGFAVANGIENILVIRINEGPELNLSSVEVGCCTDMVDRYFVGSFYNNPRSRSINILKTTRFPEQSEKPAPFIVKDRELILRSSPEVKDEYDEDASSLNNVAIFGNIVTKYLPGCSGNIISSHKDADSKLWYFVVLDELCGSLRTHVPYNVSAGWIDSTNIK